MNNSSIKGQKTIKYQGLFLLPILLAIFCMGTYSSAQEGFKSANKLFKRGTKFFVKGKMLKAEQYLTECLSKEPNYSPADYYLSQIEYNKKKFHKSHFYMARAKKKYPDYYKKTISLIKNNAEELRSRSKELKTTTKIMDGMHGDPCIANPKLMAYYNKTQNVLANSEMNKNQSVNNQILIPSKYFTLHGNIYFQLKKYQLAIRQYKISIVLSPGRSNAYNNLASLYMMAQKYNHADFYLKKAGQNGIKIKTDFVSKLSALKTEHQKAEDNQLLPLGVKRIEHLLSAGVTPVFGNTYIVFNPRTLDALLIDPGRRNKKIEAFIGEKQLKIRKILNTHGHSDHTGGNEYYSEKFGVEVHGPRDDNKLYQVGNKSNAPDHYFEKDAVFTAGAIKVKSILIAGHSPGSTCFLIDQCLFSGDTLFKGTVGAVYGANQQDRAKVLKEMTDQIRIKLLTLDKQMRVFPGHGEFTFIDQEINSNSFFETKN